MENIEVANDVSVTETQNQVITLVDEVTPEPASIPYPSVISLSCTADEEREHTIKDFLKREVIMAVGTISPTINRGEQIAEISLPSMFLKHSMIAPKIDGFRYIRGVFEVRVMHNAQPFQSGILRLVYTPMKASKSEFNTQLTHITPLTGLIGVDVNFEDKMPLLLEVPYIYPLPAYDMLVRPDDFAYVKLIVYSPLSIGSVGYTMFCRFKSVNISMPVDALNPFTSSYIIDNYKLAQKYVVPQQMFNEDSSEEEEVFPNVVSGRNSVGFWARVMVVVLSLWCWLSRRNRRYKMGIVRQHVGNEDNKRTLSGLMRAVSNIATMLSGIPLLTSVASPIATLTDGASRLASYFGYSSPRSEQVQTIIRPSLLYGMNNFNRIDISHQMALDGQNKIDISKAVFGTSMDEMSIKSCTMVPQFISSFKVSGTDIKDSMLWWDSINPLTLGLATGFDQTREYPITNLAFIAANFQLWRGSIVFNFKVAKTNFHSARLAIVWRNIESMTEKDKFTERSIFNYQVIWDLRKTYEQTLVIPYIQGIEWLTTSVRSGHTATKTFNGYLCVYLLNELQTGGTALTEIEVLVECCAGHDFELSIPRAAQDGDGYIRPTATVRFSYGEIEFKMIDGLVEEAMIPWYESKKVYVNDGINVLALAPGLKIGDEALINAEIVVNNGDAKINTQSASGAKTVHEKPPTFAWNINKSLSPTQVASQLNEVYIMEVDGRLTKIGLDRLKKLFRIGNLNYANNTFELYHGKHKHLLEINDKPVDGNRINLGRRMRKQFPDYSAFTIDTIYCLIKQNAKETLFIGTNEHGPDKDANVIFKARILKQVSQQVKYEELINSASMDNITGSMVCLPEVSSVTSGEKITSIRQLVQRYNYWGQYTSRMSADKSFLMRSDYLNFVALPTFISVTTDVATSLDYFAPMYRYYNGDIRYKLFCHREGVPVNEYMLVFMTIAGDDIAINKNTHSTVLFAGWIEGVIEFTVPYYNRMDKTVIGDPSNQYLLSFIRKIIYIGRLGLLSAPFDCDVYRAAGDNFTFGCRLSAPTVFKRKF